MRFVSLGNSASGPAIEIDAPSSVQKPPLIFRRGYVPAQCRRKLTRREGTIEGGEHVVADAKLQRPTVRLGDAETARPFLGKQADHGTDSVVTHCAGSSFANGDASSKLSAPDLRPETPWQCRAGKDAATAHVCSISFEQRVDNCNPAAGRMQRRRKHQEPQMAAMSADMRGNTDETWSSTLNWLVHNRLLAPGYGLQH